MAVTQLHRIPRSVIMILISGLLLALLAGGGLFITRQAHAAGNTYYVAPTGSDSNTGTSVSTAFQHIQKCASVAQAGDACLMESGTYHETVTPAHSGNASAPITFAPDGAAAVTVDGADPVTASWSAVSSANLTTLENGDAHLSASPFAAAVTAGNVYQASVNLTGTLSNDQLFVDGHMENQAQWPNPGTDLSHPTLGHPQSETSTSLADSALTQPAGYWNGASVWTNYWFVSETGTVASSTVGGISLTNLPEPNCIGLGNGFDGTTYHLYGNLEAFSAPNQWFYNTTSGTLYLWLANGDSPGSHAVEAKSRSLAFDLSNASYVTIRGLTINGSTITTGSSSTGVLLDTIQANYVSQYMDLAIPSDINAVATNDGCQIIAAGEGTSGIQLNGTGNTLRNSTIGYSAGNGVSLTGSGNIVSDNDIHDVDYAGTYAAGVNIIGSGQVVENNTITHVGRSGVDVDWHTNGYSSQNNHVDYNNIADTGNLSDDYGQIYVCCSLDLTGTRIDHNFLHNDAAAKAGFGVHFDNSSSNGQIDHNVSWDMSGGGIVINGGSNILVANNTWQYMGVTSSPNTIENNASTSVDNIPSGNTTLDNSFSVPATTFQNVATSDYRLVAGASEIDAGTPIAGVTTGYVGSAPDRGAYEHGGVDWLAGCAMPSCIVGTALQGITYLSDYEAENGTVSGTPIDTNHLGFSGTGFVPTVNVGSTIATPISVPITGTYVIRTRYANGTSSTNTLSYYLDGTKFHQVSFPSTVSWDEWGVVDVPVTLSAGSHTLLVKLDAGDSGYVNLDSFAIGSSTPLLSSGYAINAGGVNAGNFTADNYYSGGTSNSSSTSINTSGVTNPAPQAVYQTNRTGNFTYTLPGLLPGAQYTVRLHFAETYWSGSGQRTFNVAINGTQVLTNFDIFATAGASNKAVIETFPATSDNNGQITIQFTTVVNNALVSGIEVVFAGYAVNAGGGAVSTFAADTYATGGKSNSTTASIQTSGVTNPAPQAVYQTNRTGNYQQDGSGNFTYTIPGFSPGAQYTVRLHFAETYWTGSGQRTFNVAINGTQVLTNFDIFATAGGANIAIVETLAATADNSGQITIQFTRVVDNPLVSGIEILGT